MDKAGRIIYDMGKKGFGMYIPIISMGYEMGAAYEMGVRSVNVLHFVGL